MFKNPIILGVAGYARVGKDTFADRLAAKLDVPVLKFKFANYLKRELNIRLSDWLDVDFETEDPAIKKILRPIMVSVANDIIRAKDPSYWVRKLHEDVKTYTTKTLNFPEVGQLLFNFDKPQAHSKPDAVFIISDLRYATGSYDEIDFVNQNGISVLLERFGIDADNEVEKFHMLAVKEKASIVIDLPTLDREMEYNRYLDNVISKIFSKNP